MLLLSTGFLIYSLWSYILAKKAKKEAAQDKGAEQISTSENQNLDTSREHKYTTVLALLEQQQIIVGELKRASSAQDRLRIAILNCWELFLELESKLVKKEASVQEIDQRLVQFIPLTQENGFAEMMESLVEKIAAQRGVAKTINKDIERKNQLLMAKMGVNAELNEKFDRMKAELESEYEVDARLAEMRVELVQVYQLENAIKAKLVELKEAPNAVSEDYQLALELFLSSNDLGDFIEPLQDEFGDKIEELKSVAEYQANTIMDLKLVVKDAASKKGNHKYKIDYDIIVAKLEKSLSDKKQILSRLESKLDSLQMVKYQLAEDDQKHDRLVNEKDTELASLSEGANMQLIFSQKQVSLNNMERQLDAAPLTDESQAYAKKLAEKVSAFKSMMNESELFVEMLEFELDSEQKKNADLQTRLAELSDYVMQQSMRVESVDRKDSAQLEEVNAELLLEISTMKKESAKNTDASNESISLQNKINALNEKNSKMKQDYAELEDKFLSSLL